jgi:hypothetical protein
VIIGLRVSYDVVKSVVSLACHPDSLSGLNIDRSRPRFATCERFGRICVEGGLGSNRPMAATHSTRNLGHRRAPG